MWRPTLSLALLLLASAGCTPDPPVHTVPLDGGELRLRQAARERVARTVFEYRFDAELVLTGAARNDATVTVSSAVPATSVESGPLPFGDLRRGETATLPAAVVLRHDRRVAFDPGALGGTLAGAIARDEAGFELDPAGEWLAGDLHVHATGASNDTGPDLNSFPENIRDVALERGLFFVVLTDHSNSTGSDPSTTEEIPALFNQGPEFPYWERAAELSIPGLFLMVDGNELSPRHPGELPTGHVGCIPPDLETFERSGAFVDRPFGSVSGAQTLEQARARGCYVVLNHPYAFLPWIAADWTSFDYDAIETFNGGLGLGFTLFEQQSRDAWRCDLIAGRDVTPLASSDNHRVFDAPPGFISDPALGFPATSVFATARTWPAIMAGLRAGRVVHHMGDSRLFLAGYTADGLRALPQAVRRLRLRGQLAAGAEPKELVLRRATGCNETRPGPLPPGVIDEVLLSATIQPGERFDREVAIAGAPGVYTASLADRADPYHAAFTGALVIRAAAP